jgi:hypothetical protein
MSPSSVITADNEPDDDQLVSAILSLDARNRDEAVEFLEKNKNRITYGFCAKLIRESEKLYSSSNAARCLFIYDIASEAARIGGYRELIVKTHFGVAHPLRYAPTRLVRAILSQWNPNSIGN